jgi:hypothetical protein
MAGSGTGGTFCDARHTLEEVLYRVENVRTRGSSGKDSCNASTRPRHGACRPAAPGRPPWTRARPDPTCLRSGGRQECRAGVVALGVNGVASPGSVSLGFSHLQVTSGAVTEASLAGLFGRSTPSVPIQPFLEGAEDKPPEVPRCPRTTVAGRTIAPLGPIFLERYWKRKSHTGAEQTTAGFRCNKTTTARRQRHREKNKLPDGNQRDYQPETTKQNIGHRRRTISDGSAATSRRWWQI